MLVVKLIVHGRVQGVGYRQSILQFVVAKAPDVVGHVMNLAHGGVEIVLSGPNDQISLVENFAFEGPELAVVDHIEKLEVYGSENYDEFSIKYI